MSKNIGIDLGTSNTMMYAKGKGIVLREPSVVAEEVKTKRVLAVGSEAKRMLGKTPGSIRAVHPLKDGVIADFDSGVKMMHDFFRRVQGNTLFTKPRVIVCSPYGATEVEQRAVEDITLEGGARSVALIEEPVAAAIGAGLRVADVRGNMIVDIGGGTTAVAVLSSGGIVLAHSLRTAGDEIDSAITAYIKRKYNVLVGDNTSEMLKVRIGSVIPETDRGNMEIRGRNLMNGLPAVLTVNSGEIREAMHAQIVSILNCIKGTLEATPPELSSDIYDTGIMMTGGGALIPGLPQLISHITGIKVTVSSHALDAVAIGIGKVIDAEMNGVVTYRKN
ncbi:MAG: rod shape-determining protein [Clostridia bacterium]|nr:rod shape-determining protein [Clostridia bacterium]